MWEISNFSQATNFCFSILLGVILGLVFDIVRSMRFIFKQGKLFLFFSDLMFWIISAFLVFIFNLIFTDGVLRGFILFGTLIGFLIERYFISYFTVKFLRYIIHFLSKLYRIIIQKRNAILDRILAFIFTIIEKFRINIKIRKKTVKKP